MPPRIAPVFLALTLGFAGAAAGQEPVAEKNDASSDIRIVSVPPSVFSTIDPSNKDGARKPKPGVRAIPGRESEGFDVTEFLSKYGVSFPPGSVALYDGVLLVHDTAPNLALIDRIFGKRPLLLNSSSASIELTTYECALPESKKLLPWEELTFADIANLPAESVKLIDTASIETKSGQRCVANHVINPLTGPEAEEDNRWNTSVFHAGESGSRLDLEPVVGGDWNTVDLNIAWNLRIPAGNPRNGFTELQFTTSVTTWNEYPLVVHSAPVSGQPGKYFVVVARARSIDLDEWKMPPPGPGVKPGVIVPELNEPGLNLPPRMSMKRYRVPPGFLRMNGAKEDMSARKFLEDAGVTFPPGSEAFYDKATSSLIIINTEENLDMVDQIVDSATYVQPSIVSAELSVYECDFPGMQDPHELEKLTFAELEQQPRESVRVLDCVSILTKSGQRVVASDVVAPDPSKEEAAGQQPAQQGFRAGEMGTKFEAEPVVGPDGKKIDTNTAFNLRLETGAPGSREITEINDKATFTSESGDPHVVRVTPVENHKGKYVVVVVRMRVLNPGGWNTKATADKPAPESTKTAEAK